MAKIHSCRSVIATEADWVVFIPICIIHESLVQGSAYSYLGMDLLLYNFNLNTNVNFIEVSQNDF